MVPEPTASDAEGPDRPRSTGPWSAPPWRHPPRPRGSACASCRRHLPSRYCWHEQGYNGSGADLTLHLDVSAQAAHDFARLVGANSQTSSLCRPKGSEEFPRNEVLAHSRATILDRNAGVSDVLFHLNTDGLTGR